MRQMRSPIWNHLIERSTEVPPPKKRSSWERGGKYFPLGDMEGGPHVEVLGEIGMGSPVKDALWRGPHLREVTRDSHLERPHGTGGVPEREPL